MNLYNLENKVAIVTGVSSGLGADVAKADAEKGANVVLIGRRKEKIEQLAKEIKGNSNQIKVLPIVCD